MVLSIESIYCICFKTTIYSLALVNSECCDAHVKNKCSGNSCCKDSLKKMPCKASNIITINSKTDFTYSKLTDLVYFDIHLPGNSINLASFTNSTNIINRFYSDSSPPEYLISLPFLQSFLC